MGLELVERTDGDASFVFDARHYPVVFGTWRGAATEALLRQWFAECDTPLLERARESPPGFVIINDVLQAKAPSAKVRKVFTELTRAQAPDAHALALGSLFVVEGAILRGVMTAVLWMLPEKKTVVEAHETLPGAIERALAILQARHVLRPPNLDPHAYRRPPLYDEHSPKGTAPRVRG